MEGSKQFILTENDKNLIIAGIALIDKETTKVYDKWICPYCKNQLRWIEAFSRWYCDHCERYF
jgi:predicted amidophosphoribosyltransferase